MIPNPGIVYQDDDSIPDDELIYRMISEGNTKWLDGVAVRAGSNAFQDRPANELEALGVPAVAVSVYLESEMGERGVTPADLVSRWGDGYGVASITAGECRSHGQGIVRSPRPGHPEHGMIFVKEGATKSNRQSSRLAKASQIVIAPPSPVP